MVHAIARTLTTYGCWIALLVYAGQGTETALGANPYVPQLIDPLTESWRWRGFPELEDRGLRCLEEGADGTMWFGVDRGAIRYDGLTWRTFSNSEGLFGQVIAFARSGHQLFAATRAGIYAFKDERWHRVFPKKSAWPWIFESVNSTSDGALWASTCWGALRLQNKDPSLPPSRESEATLYSAGQVVEAFRREPSLGEIKTITVETPVRRRWLDGSGAFAFSSMRHGQLIIAIIAGSPAARAGLRIGDLVVGANGVDWRKAIRRELHAPPGTLLELEIMRPGNDAPLKIAVSCASGSDFFETFRPFQIVEDRSGTMWFGTRQGRLISLTESNDGRREWQNHTRQHKLAKVNFPSIAVTSTGIAVVGKDNAMRSMLQYDGTRWTSVVLSRPSHWSIVATDDDRLLVGADGRIISSGPSDSFVMRTKDYGIYGANVIVKQTSDKAVWIAGHNSIALRNAPQGGRWTSYRGINFQASLKDGSEWFLSSRHSVIRHSGDAWTEYSQDDGLMSMPLTVLATRAGEIWAAGSHQGVAATATFNQGKWNRQLHPELSWCIDRRAAFEDRDGRVWFGAAVGPGFRGGVTRFDGSHWKHFAGNGLDFVSSICQTRDGAVWLGGPSLIRVLPDDTVGSFNGDPLLADKQFETVANDGHGDLWAGTANSGIVRLDVALLGSANGMGRAWRNESRGLSSNGIKNILGMAGRSVLVSTNEDFDRYDGQNWQATPFPKALAFDIDVGGLRLAHDEALWINQSNLSRLSYQRFQEEAVNAADGNTFQTIRYMRDDLAPATQLVTTKPKFQLDEPAEVSWAGIDRWNSTPASGLSYSWRIDNGDWSQFSRATSTLISGDAAGRHRFQVRARDTDLNIEASPATYRFEVIPPVWRRTWFRSLILCATILAVSATLQTIRVFRHEASLRLANEQLVEAEQLLQRSNAELEDRVRKRTTELQTANEHLRKEIDERTTAEARLHASEARYRSIVEDQTEFIVRCTPTGKIEFANQAIMRAGGLSLPAKDGARTLADLSQHDRDRLQQRITSLIAELHTNTEVVLTIRLDGERWEEWHGRSIADKHGTLLGYQMIGRDMTELRRTQARLDEKGQQLAHLARVSALGEMVAEISHEINQPLSCIANFSAASIRVLDQDGDVQPHQKDLCDWAGQISEQIERISSIIRSLRRFGRPGSKQERFRIGDAVTEAMMVTESRTRHAVHAIEVDCPASLPSVIADRIQIEQVLVNLIRNACDAMEQVPADQRRLRIEAVQSEGSIVVSVIDSGPGLPSKRAKHIFNAFVTSKSDGMGIGLAVSRSIIEAHAGTIRVITDAGCGRFEFSLPITQPVVIEA